MLYTNSITPTNPMVNPEDYWPDMDNIAAWAIAHQFDPYAPPRKPTLAEAASRPDVRLVTLWELRARDTPWRVDYDDGTYAEGTEPGYLTWALRHLSDVPGSKIKIHAYLKSGW